MDWTGRVFEVRIDGVGHGGVFVGRHDGRVVFVRGALPGERVRVTVTEDRGGSFCRAETADVLEASADRVADVCPVSSLGDAGCCDFSHIAVDAQRRLKEQVLYEQLDRIAHLPRRVPVGALPGREDGTRWRTRVRLAVDPAGHAGYRQYRGHEIVPDLRCPQVVPGLVDGIDEDVWQAGSDLSIAVDDDGRRHVVEIDPPRVTQAAMHRRGRRGASARRAARSAPRPERIVEGGGSAVQRVGGREWLLAPTDFWQVHHGAAQAYADLVCEWSGLDAGDTAWDLYGGAGVFAAALAAQVGPDGHVDVVESSSQAVRDGKDALADLTAVRFHHGRVENVLPEVSARPAAGGANRRGRAAGGVPDVAVLDPPRSGAGREVVGMLADSGVARVVHVGCDPASFARDLALYAERGFVVEELRARDGFPMTHHFETFALLTR